MWKRTVAETKNVENSLQKEQGEESSAQELMHSSTQSRSGRSPRAVSAARIFKVRAMGS